jgi:hypothetical protein
MVEMSLTAQTIRAMLVTAAICLVIVVAANKASAQDTEQPEQKTGSTIRGVVTYADTGRPLRFANVHIMSNDTGLELSNGVSDRRGQFVISNVPAGRYLLFVEAPGILEPTGYELNIGSVTSQLRLNEKRELFTEVVVNGADTVDVKVQGVRGGVITGRVVTEDDQPVANADVKLLKRENDKWVPVGFTWDGTPEKNRTTDPSGVYRIAGLTAGEYIVRVSESQIGFDGKAYEQDAYSNGSLMVTYYPAATSLKEAQPVSVVEGSESSGIDIRVPDRIPRTLSGTVTIGPNNEPGGFAEVLVEYTDELGFHSSLDVTTRADNEGKWVIHGVPAGQYVIRFGGTVRVGSAETGGHVYVGTKRVSVTISNADVVLNTRLVAAAMISGRIKVDGPPPDSFYEMRPAVVPASEGSERLPNNHDFSSHRDYAAGYVRGEGVFEIRGLAAGKYWFGMSGFRADQHYVKSIMWKGVDISQRPIKLDAGIEFRDVLVTLGTDMANIEGQVSKSQPKTSVGKTKTIHGEMVVMLAPANDATRRFSPGLLTMHPDDQGRFVFACGPGDYFVAVLTRSQREKLTTPINDDYFKNDNQKFQRVKIRAGEKLKGLMLPIGDN